MMHTLMLVGIAVLLLMQTAQAADNGSLTIRLKDLGTDMEQVGIAVYQVGKVVEKSTEHTEYTLVYTLVDELSDVDIDLMELDKAEKTKEAAETLAGEVAARGMKGKEGLTDENGVVTFEGLEPGIYLVVQTSGQSRYGIMQTFLAVLPQTGANGEFVYEVEATPKAVTPVPTQPPAPTRAPSPTPTQTPVPTVTQTPAPTEAPDPSPTEIPGETPSPTPTVTPGAVPSETPAPALTQTPAPTQNPRVTVTPVEKTPGGGSDTTSNQTTTSTSTVKEPEMKQKRATKTADNTPIAAWLLLLTAAGGTAVYAGIRKKKSK